MNKIRAVLTGASIWIFIFLSFFILEYIPYIKDSLSLQASIVGILIVPYSLIGASIFYKNRNNEHGLIVGIITALTSLVLDALITVPYIEIPKGGSYISFYSFPFLWLLVAINIASMYFYWKLKIKNKINSNS